MVKPARDRLRKAFGLPDRREPAPDPARRRTLQRHGQRQRRQRQVVELPAGEEAGNERGAFWLRRLRYPGGFRHGAQPLAIARGADAAGLVRPGERQDFADWQCEHCLFLDTETTGLAGGAGTTVFLTGMAFFDGEELVVEQVFLRDFGEEPAALQHVASRLQRYPQLVTFVGKSFDRHRLAARMAVHRIGTGILEASHLDLYHVARRRWAGELPDVRLRTVEERKLGVFRQDDLPGSDAPLAYLTWLRDRSGPIDRVFEHNRLDVLSLVTLLGVLGGSG